MRSSNMLVLCCSIAVCVAGTVVGQPPGPQGERGGPGGPSEFLRMFPVMAALDTDKDGELSAKEIETAVAALKTLDKNEDGKLGEDELRPDVSGFRGGPGLGGFGRGRRGPDFGGRREVDPERMAAAFVDHFMSYDRNKDDQLSKDEVPEQMQSLLTRADKDDDGMATRDELMTLIRSEAGGGGGFGSAGGFGGPGDRGGFDIVRRMMSQDANEDGRLTKDELPEFMQQRFGEIDTDEDGALDPAELETISEQFRRRFGGRRGRRDGGRRGGNRPQRPPVEE